MPILTVLTRETVNNPPPRSSREKSPLASRINGINNDREKFSSPGGKTYFIGSLACMLKSLWPQRSSLDGMEQSDNGKDIPLTEVLCYGEALRLQAETLSATPLKKPAPYGWKGGLFKRCLVGAGLLSGAGILGDASYKYYAGRSNSGGQAGNTIRSYSVESLFDRVVPPKGSAGTLEDSFGNNALHHDGAIDITRHGRRHLPQSAKAEAIEDIRHDNGLKSYQAKHVRHSRYIKGTNEKIIQILQGKGLLGIGRICKEELLSAVAHYLFSAEKGIAGHAKELEIVARDILTADDLYGGKKNEPLSTLQAESTVRQWVFANVLGCSPEKYIIKKLKEDADTDYYTINSIHHLLSMDKLLSDKHLRADKIPVTRFGELNAMWHECLIKEMPFLEFNDGLVRNTELKSYSFANLYSGSRFLSGVSVKDYTYEDAMKVGGKMWDFAVSDGVTEDKITYFKIPALFSVAFDASYKKKSDKYHRKHYLYDIGTYIHYRKIIKKTQHEITKKYNSYLAATEAWLSKVKLADKIISRCPTLSPGLPDIADAIRTKEEIREKEEHFAKQSYINGIDKPCETAPESLDDAYQKQTADVAESFREIDKYLIHAAISALPEDERDFIFSPDAIMHSVDFKIRIFQHGLFTPQSASFTVENAELFSLRRGDEERIYAMKGESRQDGYRFIRMDRDIRNYLTNGILGDSFKDYKVTWDKVEDATDIDSFAIETGNKMMTGKGVNTESFVDLWSEKHRLSLFYSLYESGNDKSNIQKLWSVIKHLIPFYDCVEGIINNDPVQAVPSCLMDAVSFIPVFGKAANLSGKFGIGLARWLQSGVAEAGKGAISSVVKNTLSEISLPTTAELASLGKESLRVIDPGFELAFGISKKFADTIVKRLVSDKKTSELAMRITSANTFNRLPVASSGKQVDAFLPGEKLPIPVTNVEKKGMLDVFVRVNPETEEAFGKKFFLDEDNNLVPASSISINNKKPPDKNSVDSKFGNDNIYDNKDCYRVKRGANLGRICSQSSSSDTSQEYTDFELSDNVSNEGITADESRSLKDYGKTSSSDVNEFMFAGMPKNYLTPYLRAPIAEAVKNIKSALQKIPPYQGVVYRGSSIKQSIYDSLQNGKIVSSRGFMSSTINIDVAKNFKTKELKYFKAVMYEINLERSGHPISMYTEKFYESEVLIENDVFFRVIDVNDENIKLEEVDASLLSQREKDAVIYIDFYAGIIQL